MELIESIEAIEVLDSRGYPTLKVTVTSNKGKKGSAYVPSGASTGTKEALELRDQDPKRFLGKGVLKAVAHVKGPLQERLQGVSLEDLDAIDQSMITLDGTENKSRLGANAILGVSLAAARCASKAYDLPLYRLLGKQERFILPCPMMNILNGGVHADNGLTFQEFMIRPVGAPSFSEAIRWGAEVFQTLKGLLRDAALSVNVGDEGGFAPNLSSNEEAIEWVLRAIERAGFRPKEEITIALDAASSEFFDQGKYREKRGEKVRTAGEMVQYFANLIKLYPIDSIEDGLDENDWEGWRALTKELGSKVQIVGDDLFVTQQKYLQKGIEERAANAILLKVNQVGTLFETRQALEMAKSVSWGTVFSHRSGETEDTTIADLSVAFGAGQIKTGSLCRSERVAKYNRLLEIEQELGSHAVFVGR